MKHDTMSNKFIVTNILRSSLRRLAPPSQNHKSDKQNGRTLLDLKRNGGSWEQIATGLGSGRTAKQCQERWTNVVDPSRVKTGWSEDEDKILIEKHAELHGKFAQIRLGCPAAVIMIVNSAI